MVGGLRDAILEGHHRPPTLSLRRAVHFAFASAKKVASIAPEATTTVVSSGRRFEAHSDASGEYLCSCAWARSAARAGLGPLVRDPTDPAALVDGGAGLEVPAFVDASAGAGGGTGAV